MKLLADDLCWKCKKETGTFLHCMWDCVFIRPFWTRILKIFSDWLGSEISLNPKLCLLGDKSLTPNVTASSCNIVHFYNTTEWWQQKNFRRVCMAAMHVGILGGRWWDVFLYTSGCDLVHMKTHPLFLFVYQTLLSLWPNIDKQVNFVLYHAFHNHNTHFAHVKTKYFCAHSWIMSTPSVHYGHWRFLHRVLRTLASCSVQYIFTREYACTLFNHSV